MKKSFSKSFIVDKPAAEVFNAIKNVRGWWSGLFSEEFEGSTEKIGDEFSFRAGGGVHYSKQKLVEVVPNKKIVWLITDSELSFLKNKNEWTGTRIVFDLSEEGDKTRLTFTHEGLVPEFECYDTCSSVWSQYLQERLLPLIDSITNKKIEMPETF